MKQLFFLVSLLSLAIATISCKSKKNMASSETAATVIDEKTIQYRVIISFISKGAGIDGSLRTSILDYINSHPKKPIAKSVLWGREGENDQCYTLKELSKSEQLAFITEIKKLKGSSDMVNITENAKCPHAGR